MKRMIISALAAVGAVTLFTITATNAISSSSQAGALVRLQATTGTPQTGNINVSGKLTAGGLSIQSGIISVTSANPAACVIEGINTSAVNNSFGVCGQNTALTGNQCGVMGMSHAANVNGIGVCGEALAGIGVSGKGGAVGVNGLAFTGVIGTSASTNGNGVVGEANGGNDAWGTSGKTNSGQAGVFQAGTISGGGFPALTGVVAKSTGASGYGLYAVNANLVTGRAGYFAGKVQIVDGTQGPNSVLVGTGGGTASWQTAASLGAANNWGASLWTLSGNNLYPNTFATWLTGIGTSTPAAKLHVNDTALAANAEALRVTYGGTGTLSEGIDVITTPLVNGTGSQHGVAANASVNGTGVGANSAGSSSGVLANSSVFFAQAGFNGVSATSTATSLDNFSASNVSSATGGTFSANVNNIGIGALGTYWLAGSYSTISGAVNATLPAGAIAAVLGVDNVTGSAPHWAGFFQGNAFVSGNVGIATGAPTANLDVNGVVRIRGGSPANGKFLKSVNANGDAIWDTVTGTGFSLPFTGSATTKAAGNFCNGVFEVDTTGGNTFTAICGRTNGNVQGPSPLADAGVKGLGSSSGVIGEANFTSGSIGVAGFSTNGRGVYGSGSAFSYGVYGTNGTVPNGSNWAVNGPSAVFANGQLGGSGTKPFRIDHPFDPLNKFLYHFSSEGPEPLNIYCGTVTTDAKGTAWVDLPNYFEEINKNPRYQLTVIEDEESDEFVQVKVARKVKDNRFKIMTSAPNVEVSWEVKATRNDLWMRKYGATVEVDKPEHERGTYQRPELYDAPPAMGADFPRPYGTVTKLKKK